MKLKLRASILITIFFIFFVSFKIIEPELDEHAGGRDVRESSDYDVSDTHDDRTGDSIKQTVNRLKQAYDLNWNASFSGNLWDVAESWVTSRRIHPENTPELGAILHRMATSKITHAGLGYRGTQLKMSLTLDGGQRAAFKPKWFERDHVIEGKPYDGADRHNGEIAAFHLNRMLGFGRSPIVVGRIVNMESEIRPVADQKLLDTFYEKDGNTCFYGKCYYCKGPETGVCASNTLLEGAVILWLPTPWTFKTTRNPWGRTYRDGLQAQWETDGNYCQKVRHSSPYDEGPRLLDLIDATVFDYLIGNADAHHYDTFGGHEDSVVVLLDRAKSFGNPGWDEETILAPLYQCCSIRKSTWERLRLLQDGVLSTVLKQILSHDLIAPVLSEAHYSAMDRRLQTILRMVESCAEHKGLQRVLVEDKYSMNTSES